MARQAFIYAVASAFCFSVINIFIKMMGNEMPEAEVLFFRGMIGTIATLAVMWYKKLVFFQSDRGLLSLRGILGGLGALCNFISLANMKLADASILFQMSGVFVFIFSAVFLKEKLPHGAGKWLLVILAAVGCIINPFGYDSFTIYALYALAGAAFSAAAYTTIRKISMNGRHSPYEIMFYFLFTSMLVGGFFMRDGFVIPDLRQAILLLLIGSISVFAQFFMTGAFIATNAVLAQFLQYIGVFFNAFWGFVVFGETLSWVVVAGGAALFLSSVMLSRLKEEHMAKAIIDREHS